MGEGIGKSVSRNVGVLFVMRGVTWSATFLLMMFLPRYMGPVNYGRFYLAQSIVVIFGMLVDFGGYYSITKAVSRNRSEVGHIFADAVGIRLILSAITFVMLITFGHVSNYPSAVIVMMAIFGAALFFQGIRTALWNCYQAFEWMKYPAYGAMAEATFVSAVGIIALIAGIGPIGFSVITVLGSFAGFVIMASFARRIIPVLPRVNWRGSLKLLKDGVPYFLNSVFGIIYYRIDTVMLSKMTPESVIGWYGASYKFFDTMMFLPNIFTIAVFPALSRLWGEKSDSMNRSAQKSLDFILMAGIPLGIGVCGFAREIVIFFYGLSGYEPSILLLRIFAIGALLVYIDMVLGTVLLATDKQFQLSLSALAAIFVNVSLNYALIPYTQTHYGNGGIGAAIATLLTEFFVMITMIALLPKGIFADTRLTIQLKTIGAGVVMAVSFFVLNFLGVSWFPIALVSTSLYLIVLTLIGALQKSDVELIKAALPFEKLWPKKVVRTEY